MKNPPKKDDPLAGDLSDFIAKAKWRKVRFIFVPKDTKVTLHLTKSMVATAKKIAKKNGITCQHLLRDAIAEYLAKAA